MNEDTNEPWEAVLGGLHSQLCLIALTFHWGRQDILELPVAEITEYAKYCYAYHKAKGGESPDD